MDVIYENILNLQWQQVVMWCIGGLLIYLAIGRKMEPALLLPMGFGAILVNLPMSGAGTQIYEGVEELGALPDLAGAHLKVLAQVTDFQQDFLFSHGRLPPLVPAAPRRSAGGRPPDDPARAP